MNKLTFYLQYRCFSENLLLLVTHNNTSTVFVSCITRPSTYQLQSCTFREPPTAIHCHELAEGSTVQEPQTVIRSMDQPGDETCCGTHTTPHTDDTRCKAVSAKGPINTHPYLPGGSFRVNSTNGSHIAHKIPKITLVRIMKACQILGCNSEYFWRYGLSNILFGMAFLPSRLKC